LRTHCTSALALFLAEGTLPALGHQHHLDVLTVDVFQADPAVVLGAVLPLIPADGLEVEGLMMALVAGGRHGLLLIRHGLLLLTALDGNGVQHAFGYLADGEVILRSLYPPLFASGTR